jgi:hypothetical protein
MSVDCRIRFCLPTRTTLEVDRRFAQRRDRSGTGRASGARFALDSPSRCDPGSRRLGELRKRVASNRFEPASGNGFALLHATLGVRAGRWKKHHANHREAGDGVTLAVLPVSRAQRAAKHRGGHDGQAVERPSLHRPAGAQERAFANLPDLSRVGDASLKQDSARRIVDEVEQERMVDPK